jgi:hypothetical protein
VSPWGLIFDGPRSAKAEERQDEHDDDDQADQVNQAAHGYLPNAIARSCALPKKYADLK